MKKKSLIDPNHSHFIFVDNSVLNLFGGEIPYRTKLEKTLQLKSKSVKIPLVLIVVGGGPNTYKTVGETVKEKTPCVFIDVCFSVTL